MTFNIINGLCRLKRTGVPFLRNGHAFLAEFARVTILKTVWIIYPYGAIVGEKYLEARHIRFGKMLAENGYKVVFWTSNFSHGAKTFRSDGWKTVNVCNNFEIVLVPSTSDKKNISVRRARFEINYSRNLEKKFYSLDKPDLIITAGTGFLTAFYPVWPYVKKKNIPVIYDIMDVHPFSNYMKLHHKKLMLFANLLTRSIEWRAKVFYKHVSAVCGLGRNQLMIAKERTGRTDIPACLVYNGIDVTAFRKRMELTCQADLPEKKEGEVWCIYAGSLGPSYDIKTLLACAERARKADDNIRFIVAGAGPQWSFVDYASKNNPKITFLGSVDASWLPAIYKKCDIGLCTYASFSTVDMPDKFYDYTAAGLAVVNSLQGEVKEYVQDAGVGLQYESENSDSLYAAIKKAVAHLIDYKKASYDLAGRFDLNEQLKPLLQMIRDLIGE